MRRARRLAWLFAIASLGTVAAVQITAPHLWWALREGFPAEEWSPDMQARHTVVSGLARPAIAPKDPLPEAAATRFAQSGGRALLVDRGGEIVAAAYGTDVGPSDRLNSFSLVKSLVGVLTLRGVADGVIGSLDDPIARYLPGAPAVSVREVLAMRSGLLAGDEPAKSLDDGGYSPLGALAKLHVAGIDATLPTLSVDEARRGSFAYQSANTALLGAVLEEAYGQSLETLLSDLIWTPAGAGEAFWRTYPQSDAVTAYCCLYATPSDWLRVGRYLLDNGRPDAPFLPQDLWQEWILPDLTRDARRGNFYGWHLRHDVLDREGGSIAGPLAYFAGHLGQRVYLLPEQDAVVVRFGAQPQLLHSTLYELFE